ncbi:MAG: hypothetical protein FD174_3711 [Geobacteraceae bacterium]|nr:MAG: hypothetical protein FD174_3711 [Geobacteraceae bacterium]
MINRIDLVYRFAVSMFLLIITALPVLAEEKVAAEEAVRAALAPDEGDESGELLVEEEAPSEVKIETHTLFGGFAGYRFLTVDSFGGRAAEYEYLHSNPVLGAYYNRLGKDLKYGLEGSFLNDKDYRGDLLFDYAGDYRFHLRTESLFHNLDREELFSPSPFNLGTASYNASIDTAAPLGIRVEQDLATFRYKIHNYPFHLNLGYWRLFKEGSRQLIFADQAFEGTSNTIFSRARAVDRQTHEGTAGFDTHLGPVDLIYTFRIRQFEDNAGIMRDQFSGRTSTLTRRLNFDTTSGLQQHNEDPDSRFFSHTVKLHTSLADGIVGAASYTYGKRENLSGLSDIRGADQTFAILQNAAGDFIYTPCKEFTLALKYRLQEVDNNNPAVISSSFAVPSTVEARPSLDTRKDVITATFSARPHNLLTFKGEYKGTFLHRDNVHNDNILLTWKHLPENSETHRGTFSVLSRPLKGLKLKALYGYSATDHPSYGNSFGEKHEGQLLASYNSLNRWGGNANYQIVRELNDRIDRSILTFLSPLPPSPQPTFEFNADSPPLSRDRRANNFTASLWFTPFERFTITGSYSLLRSRIDQGVFFTVVNTGSRDATNYETQAQLVSINGLYHFDEKLDLSLALQQIRSFSEFEPAFIAPVAGSDTGGIKDISRIRTVESSLSARAGYHLTKNLNCALDYTFRDYDEKNSSLFDGTVQTVMAYLSAKW